MDNDSIMSQFDQVEEKIGHLINRCRALESSNIELSEKIKSLEAELTKKGEKEDTHSQQKALIRSKIDNILAKLNNFNESNVA